MGVIARAGAMVSVALAAAALPARADGVVIDWARGLVVAESTAVADRRAPSPALGRDAARRRAENAARAELVRAIATLPWHGATPALDDAARTALAARARPLTTEPRPDGGWRASLAVPIEAIRVAARGPRLVAPATDDVAAPHTIVIDWDGGALAPGVGLALADGSRRWEGPVRWLAAGDDGDLGGPAVRLRSRRFVDGALELAEPLPAGAEAALVIVRRKP